MKLFKTEISNRFVFGCLILIFGAIVAYSGIYGASYGPNGIREHVHVSPGPLHPFWLPLSYDVIRVPDYTIAILTVGVVIGTTGFWILIYDITHRHLHTPL